LTAQIEQENAGEETDVIRRETAVWKAACGKHTPATLLRVGLTRRYRRSTWRHI